MSLEWTGSVVAIAKTGGYIGAIAFFEYLGIPQTQLGILALLMIIDWFTGVSKQFVLNRKDITSQKAYIGIMKKLVTVMIVMIVALMFKGLDIVGDVYLKGVLSLLIMAETYSSIQNIYTVRTGKLLPEFDVISILLKSFGDVIKNKLESAISNTANSKALEDSLKPINVELEVEDKKN